MISISVAAPVFSYRHGYKKDPLGVTRPPLGPSLGQQLSADSNTVAFGGILRTHAYTVASAVQGYDGAPGFGSLMNISGGIHSKMANQKKIIVFRYTGGDGDVVAWNQMGSDFDTPRRGAGSLLE
jgi:hypothetical protein